MGLHPGSAAPIPLGGQRQWELRPSHFPLRPEPGPILTAGSVQSALSRGSEAVSLSGRGEGFLQLPGAPPLPPPHAVSQPGGWLGNRRALLPARVRHPAGGWRPARGERRSWLSTLPPLWLGCTAAVQSTVGILTPYSSTPATPPGPHWAPAVRGEQTPARPFPVLSLVQETHKIKEPCP